MKHGSCQFAPIQPASYGACATATVDYGDSDLPTAEQTIMSQRILCASHRWQAISLVYSLKNAYRKAGLPAGPITRLISCTDAQWAAEPYKQFVPTFRVRAADLFPLECMKCGRLESFTDPCVSSASFDRHTVLELSSCPLLWGCCAQASSLSVHNGDAYGGYNKPEAVREWLDHVEPESDTVCCSQERLLSHAHCSRQLAAAPCSRVPDIRLRQGHRAHTPSAQVLILDTDLIIRTPFLPAQLHVRHGFARSAEFGYMKGAARPAPAPLPDLASVHLCCLSVPGGPYLSARHDAVRRSKQ